MLTAQQFGEKLATLRSQAAAREDALLVDTFDLLHAVFFEGVGAPEEPPQDPPEEPVVGIAGGLDHDLQPDSPPDSPPVVE